MFTPKVGDSYLVWLDSPEIEGRAKLIEFGDVYDGRDMAVFEAEEDGPIVGFLRKDAESDPRRFVALARYDGSIRDMEVLGGTMVPLTLAKLRAGADTRLKVIRSDLHYIGPGALRVVEA